ncbi:MAG: class I SAM-dependent methyltransferase [Gallionella sp.]|nr:class I SAM-dependent methyltransferase [Gallionella sp.]
MPNSLPAPSQPALEHSARLTTLIQNEIVSSGGWIPFARYMELALYAPGLGYYTAGAHKFGEAGDFITAPELSALFGRTLARQVRQIMAQSAPHILELGAGSGKLAVDMLAELEQLDRLPVSYSILEVSADLRERQRAQVAQRLPHLLARVHWLDALPETFSGAVFANEVLDALPVHLVHWRDSRLFERGVVNEGAGFTWQERDISDAALRDAAQAIRPDETTSHSTRLSKNNSQVAGYELVEAMPDDYLSEICLAARGLIQSLASRLDIGALLFIDYGFGAREFYHPQRDKGTLMCHYRHHAHDDPFYLPGLQDITAHVNFTDIGETGIDAGLELTGYTNQAFFLINGGITDLLAQHQPENVRDYLPLSGQLQKLTSPAEMGDLFKVIALGKKLANPLTGFARGDLSRAL